MSNCERSQVTDGNLHRMEKHKRWHARRAQLETCCICGRAFPQVERYRHHDSDIDQVLDVRAIYQTLSSSTMLPHSTFTMGKLLTSRIGLRLYLPKPTPLHVSPSSVEGPLRLDSTVTVAVTSTLSRRGGFYALQRPKQ